MISVVIPTYNRPDTLRVAIGSVLGQTRGDWELLVVGDCCSAETGEVVGSFEDRRIRFCNLPRRFGEQSGPNSVGLALVSGRHVAFLNHDDVWLPDHLELGMEALGSAGDFYLGRSVFARDSVADERHGAAPVFSEVNPPGRRPRDFFVGHPVLIEPASAWIVSAAAARRIGSWCSAAAIFRSPAQEWTMRAWRRGTEFVFGDEITVLKVVTHYQYESASGNYSRRSREHQWVAELLATRTADEVRALVRGQIDPTIDHYRLKAPWPETRWQRLLHRALIGPEAAAIYRRTGRDGFDLYCRLVGQRRGKVLNDASRKRTGAPLPAPPNLADLIAAVEIERR